MAIHATQKRTINHAALSLFGEDVLMLVADVDEFVASPTPDIRLAEVLGLPGSRTDTPCHSFEHMGIAHIGRFVARCLECEASGIVDVEKLWGIDKQVCVTTLCVVYSQSVRAHPTHNPVLAVIVHSSASGTQRR